MNTIINIYLNPEERKNLRSKQKHYEVSMSTIAQKTAYAVLKQIVQNNMIHNEQKELILNSYIYPSGNKKTSIKPKEMDILRNLLKSATNEDIKVSRFYTNCLKMYANNNFKEYFNQEACTEIHKYIDKELNKTDETWYDYNEFCRNSNRYQNWLNKKGQKNELHSKN